MDYLIISNYKFVSILVHKIFIKIVYRDSVFLYTFFTRWFSKISISFIGEEVGVSYLGYADKNVLKFL